MDSARPHVASVVDALIATEDHRFWQHGGVDWRRILAAGVFTLGGDRQGGSTITQQLARNVFPEQIGHARTATRKLKELITAIKLEHAYSKREILEAYLNTVPFHYNAFGIEMAARTYFDKPASVLSVNEAATLVGMLKGTSAYNPVRNPQRAVDRRNVVLSQMVRYGNLRQDQYERLSLKPLALHFARQDQGNSLAPHFADAVRRWLLGWGEMLGYDLDADGLVVHTALDPALQRLANQAVAHQLADLQAVADVEWGRQGGQLLSTRPEPYRQAPRKVEPFAYFWRAHPDTLDAFIRESPEFASLVDDGVAKDDALARLRADAAFIDALVADKTRLEGGLVAVDPATGQVRAWVGSRDYATDSFDHVQQARRQPGSTFKPFVYGAALEAGMDPRLEFRTRAVSIELPGGQVWRPRDVEAPARETATLEEGLVYSLNSVTAQVIDRVGADKVAGFAQRAGVRESRLDAVPSLALGTSPVTLLEMVSAYGTIASLGAYHAPLLVTRIDDARGHLLARFSAPPGDAPPRAFKPDVAIELIEMLRRVVDRGTGRAVRDTFGIHADVAGQDRDHAEQHRWLVHSHAPEPRRRGLGRLRRSAHRHARRILGQGAHNALRLTGDFMRQAIEQRAIDERAGFPSRAGVGIQSLLQRAGDVFRNLFRFGSN